jgi:type IV pilus assembly protein PilM
VHLHEALSRKLGISLEEARALRRRLGETGDTSETTKRDSVRQAVFDATRSTLEGLAREISLCLRYYSVTFRGHRPSKVRLLGGEACDPQLRSTLAAGLSVPVEAASPLHSVRYERMRQSDSQGPLCEWAMAFGLSLKLTTTYFGARDGKRRGDLSSETAGGVAELVEDADVVAETSGAIQEKQEMTHA